MGYLSRVSRAHGTYGGTLNEQPTVQEESLLSYDSKPWLNSYPAGVPSEVNIPDITLVDMLKETVAAYPNKTASVFFGGKMSFRSLDRESNKFANQLIALGLQPGQPVLALLPNVPQFLIAAYGILKAGGIIAALNPLLVEREIRQLGEDSGAKIIITLDRFWNHVEPILDSGVLDVAIITGVQDGLPTIKRLLYPIKFRNEIVKVDHNPSRGRYQYRSLLSRASNTAPDIDISSESTAMFQYTGGTTGLPKAAVLTHRNLVANSIQIQAWITDIKVGEERLMAILPFFHAYGGTLCLFLAIRVAATIVMVPRFEIKEVMEQIEEYQPTVLPGVPTLYNALINAARNDPKRRQALRSIRYCVSGGAPLPPEVKREFEEATGGRLVEGYGLTEASPVTHVNPMDGRARNGTIGLPIPNTDAAIVTLDTRESVLPGERGELAIRGPQVMQGYWGRPEETRDVLSSDGWLYTGDIAIMDEDGFFRIVDRQKDVIITAGENVYPREIEEVLYEHPDIHEVCVAAVPHRAGGQVAKAFIVLNPGATLTRRDVLQYSNEHLAKYKVPRLIEFRDQLPKSAAGKILRRELQEEEQRKIEEAASSDS